MPMNKEQIAPALGSLPSGLYVLACGEDFAVVSWVQQAGFEPPMITLALRHGRGAAEGVLARKPFTLSVLPEDGIRLAKPFFAGDRAGVASMLDEQGALKGAHAWLRCEYERHISSGDHHVVLANVSEGSPPLRQGSRPLVHLRKDGFRY